jgi:hypothetical protein
VKLARIAALFEPRTTPITISPITASVLVEVKTFWMRLASANPLVFVHVSNTIMRIPTSCCVERLTA